jgi:sugar phosphate isomerase/epimerase
VEYQGAFQRLPEIFHDAAGLAGSAGVRVVWEFEPGFVFNKPSEVLSCILRSHTRNFFVLFDTSTQHVQRRWARQHGKREVLRRRAEFLRLLQGRVGHIHIIDSDGTLHADETSTHRPFGEGVIDFKALAPLMLAEPRVEWWCVDHCFWAGCWDLVGSSVAFVRSLSLKTVAA